MILAASLIFGTLIGWRPGRSRNAYALFTSILLVVLAVQTSLLWTSSDDVRDRSTGEIETFYPVLCVVILALGLAIVTVVGTIRQRRRLTQPAAFSSAGE